MDNHPARATSGFDESVSPIVRRFGPTVLYALLALKIYLLFLFALNSRFVMDEFVQLGWSKYIGNGLFASVWPAKAAGPQLFYKLVQVSGSDAAAILLMGRMQTAFLACGTLAIVYSCARTLGQSRIRALLILLVLLSFSNFIERAFRIISEPLALFFAAAALLVILRRGAGSGRAVLVAGALSGLSFLATQKAVYFNVSLGLALCGDAALARKYADTIKRGGLLLTGWFVPIVCYCLAFGGNDAIAVSKSLFLGPLGVLSPQIAAEYGGLRHFVLQTLQRNALLYAFCFAGIALSLMRIRAVDQNKRIALIFTIIISAFVFAHDQPWPYVFIMALPFMALWCLETLDPGEVSQRVLRLGAAALTIAFIASFVRNVRYLEIDNRDQLEVVARAESLLGRHDRYFDGISMLPNRQESSTIWLDRHAVLGTLRDGERSEVYRMFAHRPPKVVLWSYRLDAIRPLIGPIVRERYTKIGPNLLIAGARIKPGSPHTIFYVPIAGQYAVYDRTGRPRQDAPILVDGLSKKAPFYLSRGAKQIKMPASENELFILPANLRPGPLRPDEEDKSLFDRVYD